MSDPRMRMAAVAGSLALSASLALAPAAMAQDGPEATIEGFLDAVVAKDFEALSGFFCEDEAGQADRFNFAEVTEGLPPMMLEPLLEAFQLDLELSVLELVSESEAEAVVHVAGSLGIDIDPEPLAPLIEMFMGLSGQEVTEESIDATIDDMFGQIQAQANAIDTDVTLVPGDEGWLICSDLDFIAVDLFGAGPDVMADEEDGA